MAAQHDSPSRAGLSPTFPGQSRRHITASVENRIVRQVEAIDAWNCARRKRQAALDRVSMSRLDREAADRQAEAMSRTQQAIATCTARGLAREAVPMVLPRATAVIAHRHAWFAEKVAALLAGHGVNVVGWTDNGAEALGFVIAEQPSIVLAGDRLAMIPGDVLLSEVRLFAPATLRALQVSDPQQADAWRTRADAVFLRQHPPADVASILNKLCHAPTLAQGVG